MSANYDKLNYPERFELLNHVNRRNARAEISFKIEAERKNNLKLKYFSIFFFFYCSVLKWKIFDNIEMKLFD